MSSINEDAAVDVVEEEVVVALADFFCGGLAMTFMLSKSSSESDSLSLRTSRIAIFFCTGGRLMPVLNLFPC